MNRIWEGRSRTLAKSAIGNEFLLGISEDNEKERWIS